MSLPTFNGLRKDWPEIKAVWKSVAEAVYTNKTALAHELKNLLKAKLTNASLSLKRTMLCGKGWRIITKMEEQVSKQH